MSRAIPEFPVWSFGACYRAKFIFFYTFKEITGALVVASHERGKAIPLQALTGPEGSRRLRVPDFKIIGT
jgi:hypothetical protein